MNRHTSNSRVSFRILYVAAALAALLAMLAVPAAGGEGGGEAVVKRGASIGESPTVAVADVVKAPEKFLDKPVVFEGTIAEVCQKKGCWMEVTTGETKTSVRVTFKDYGFFVPMDSHGMIVRAEGLFHTKVWSKEDADHLAAEGANLTRNADGTATELSFIASGVELRRPKPEKSKPEAKSDKSVN